MREWKTMRHRRAVAFLLGCGLLALGAGFAKPAPQAALPTHRF